MPSMKRTYAPKSQVSVPKLSQSEIEYVIDDVVANVRQDFLDDGPGEQALRRLLHTWCSKVMTSQLPLNLPLGIPHFNDSQSSKDKDKNSLIGPSSYGVSSLPVKKEEEKEPICKPNPKPKEGTFVEIPHDNDYEIKAE